MIKIRTSGLYTSLQDTGRFGYRHQGIPVSGAMDLESASLANRLLGNPKDEAVLEFTLLGPTLFFETECVICVSGTLFKPLLNGVAIAMLQRVLIPKNSTLKLGTSISGVRGYIAVQGGFDSEKVLGSYSQYKGITKEPRLLKGAVLALKQPHSNLSNISEAIQPSALSSACDEDAAGIYLTVTKGSEFDKLSVKEQELLMQFNGVVDLQSNRMAYVLGNLPEVHPSGIITSPVQPGTVQLTPSGQCIVLMRDAQTTGGYARVLQLTPASINILSQKRPLEKVRFKWMSYSLKTFIVISIIFLYSF